MLAAFQRRRYDLPEAQKVEALCDTSGSIGKIDLSALSRWLKTVRLPAGVSILTANRLVVVARGSVCIDPNIAEAAGALEPVGTFGKGHVFGAEELLEHRPTVLSSPRTAGKQVARSFSSQGPNTCTWSGFFRRPPSQQGGRL